MQKKFIDTLIFLILLFTATWSQDNNADRTEAPYFFIQTDNPELDQLPLKSTRVDVNISGVIADVTIIQVYHNAGKRALEAIYVFPASTHAAVYKLRMTIGTRIIEAKVEERKKAREEYETAKQEGYSASLLEQQRPNVFQMNIANIMPGDTIRVELRYTELLVPEEKEYVFVFPTVVGPRYKGASSTGENWVENPYLNEGIKASYTFDIGVKISTGIPIKQITCLSHRTRIDYVSANQAKLQLDPDESKGGDRDFILHYRLSGNQIENGMLLYKGESENFFLLMVQPPERVKPEAIPAREYIFIVDVSGSMHGFPLEISKSLIRDLVRNLRSGDYFNILLFAGGSSLLSHESLPANENNINRALNLIDRQTGGGGTEVLPALKQALGLPRPGTLSRTIVIVTDGYVNVEKEAFELIRNNLNKANLFPFGIGSSVNRFMIEGLARAGQGEPFIVSEYSEGAEMADRFRRYIETPVLTHIAYDFENFDVYDVEPKVVPDVFSERPVIIYGKWKGSVQGKIRVTGRSTGDRMHNFITEIGPIEPQESHQALRYLWARNRIAMISDYYKIDQNEDARQEVTSLGLTYNLLTEFTSFLAIDSERRNNDANIVTVKQPLPLPQGVTGYALARSAGSGHKLVRPASYQSTEALDASQVKSTFEKESLHISVGHIVPTKGADSLAVKYFLNKHLKDMEQCLKKDLSGSQKKKIVLLLVIEADGTCTQAKIIHHTLTNSTFTKCFINIFKKVNFAGNWPEQTSRVTCELILQ